MKENGVQNGRSNVRGRPRQLGDTAQLTAAKKSRVLELLGKGLSITTAARGAGAHRNSIYMWRDNDPQFAADMAAAQEAGLDQVEDMVLKAAPTDWRAAAFILERKRSAEWGQKVKNYNVNEDGPNKAAGKERSDARLAELLERLGEGRADRLAGGEAAPKRTPKLPGVHKAN